MRHSFHAFRLAFAAVAAVPSTIVVALNRSDSVEPLFVIVGLVLVGINAVTALGVRRHDDGTIGFSMALHATNVYGAVIALVYLKHATNYEMRRSDLVDVAESFAIATAFLFMIPLYRTYVPADLEAFKGGLKRGVVTFIVLMLVTLLLIASALG